MSIPTFSVIIPTFERHQKLKRCLEAIAKLNYPSNKFEVIVVNDGGAAFPDELLSSFKENINLTILHPPHLGLAGARNFGAEKAKNDFLAFIDDDCEPDVNWLNDLSAQFNLTPEYLLGGRTINALQTNIFSETSQMLVDYLYDYAAKSNPNFAFFTGNNLALARTGFFSIGGFDQTFPVAAGEDRDFCCRWLEGRGESHLLNAAVVRHHHKLSLKSLWRQHFNYGRGSYYFRRQRAERFQQTVKVEPFSFYFRMFLFPFYQTSIWRGCLIAFLFFVIQCANTLGFLWGNFAYHQNLLKHP